LSVHFHIARGEKGTTWTLHFKDLSGNVVDTVTSQSGRGTVGDGWSQDVGETGAFVEFEWNGGVKGPTVVIDQYSYPIKSTKPQAIWGEDQRKSIVVEPEPIRNLGAPVARLRIKVAAGEALCTGFLLSRDLLITNYHCVGSQKDAVNTYADFGYNVDGGTYQTYIGEKLELSNIGLDYSLVRLEGAPGAIYGNVREPADNQADLLSGHSLLLIEHAAGEATQVSIDDCNVVSASLVGVNPKLKTDFGHHCDTLGGSSGSPVFDFKSRALVGLHHIGFDSTQVQSGNDSPRFENQAVYWAGVIQDIRRKSRVIYQEIMSAGR
jgi:hypothetical protein